MSAAERPRPHPRGQLDWLRSGPLYRVHDDGVPALDDYLERGGYRRFELDGREMTSRVAAHAHLGAVLGFPDWYGPSWDAFNDCLGEFVHTHDGRLLALVWHHVEAAAQAAPVTTTEVGWALLELAFGQMPSLPPSVTWSVDVDVFAIGSGADFDRPPS